MSGPGEKRRIDGGTIAFIMAGFIAFGAGAWMAASGERPMGIMFMGFGLMFQVLSLTRLKKSRVQSAGNGGSET